jgi:hypothetical protein
VDEREERHVDLEVMAHTEIMLAFLRYGMWDGETSEHDEAVEDGLDLAGLGPFLD